MAFLLDSALNHAFRGMYHTCFKLPRSVHCIVVCSLFNKAVQFKRSQAHQVHGVDIAEVDLLNVGHCRFLFLKDALDSIGSVCIVSCLHCMYKCYIAKIYVIQPLI